MAIPQWSGSILGQAQNGTGSKTDKNDGFDNYSTVS